LAKIAVDVDRAVAQRIRLGTAGRTDARVLAHGTQWSVADVVCTCGPGDRPFEERHDRFSIALVAAGSFQYRSTSGAVLVTPGALMLGAAGQCFECGHEHAAGDRCVSFWYDAAYFERIAADAGWRGPLQFRAPRVPPVRPLSAVAARMLAGLQQPADTSWEEIGVTLAALAIECTSNHPVSVPTIPGAEARVTRALRAIDRSDDGDLTLSALARTARLSPFHFLRTFERLTGLTPHQYVRRARLRTAASRLIGGRDKVLDVALDSGFGDVSNFNRAFKGEFGVSPKVFRAHDRASIGE
jgi:AraC family transcriptional regulator